MPPEEPEVTELRAQERDAANATKQAEEIVLRVAREKNPSSLRELREHLDATDVGDIDRAMVAVAIWRLLNRKQLELTPDRRLQVAG